MRTAYSQTRLRHREAPSSSTSTVAVAEPETAKKPRLDHPRLPADIEYSILLRLPVKTLTRLKCACKSWYSLISSHQFQQNYYRYSETNPNLLLLRRAAGSRTLEFNKFYVDGPPISKFYKTVPYIYQTNRILPIQSCLGLVCIAHSYEDRPILICSPSTEDLIILPRLQLPSHVVLCTGFGYAAATNDFKVVSFYTDIHTSQKYCMVFTLGTSEWREARTPSPYKVRPGTAPYLNGFLHLLPHTSGEEIRYIVAFDMESEEEYKRVPLPEYYHSIVENSHCHYFDKMCLNVVGGSLCLSIFRCGSERNMELWFLKDYNNLEWVKGYHIDISKLRLTFHDWVHPVGLMVDGSILLNICKEYRSEYLLYFPNDEKFAEEPIKDCIGAFYVESFFPQRNRIMSILPYAAHGTVHVAHPFSSMSRASSRHSVLPRLSIGAMKLCTLI